MRRWKQQQYTENPAYREKSKERQKVWRKRYPSHQYQKGYRESHPEYVNRNRQLQKERNRKRNTTEPPVSMIVKTDALVFQPRDDGAYMLSKVKKEIVVNRNALASQMVSNRVDYALIKVIIPKIVNRNAFPSQVADI
ncbi:MAG: hypothetical protein ACREHG_04860 [Candidatus Saccharimonadales bacterium]